MPLLNIWAPAPEKLSAHLCIKMLFTINYYLHLTNLKNQKKQILVNQNFYKNVKIINISATSSPSQCFIAVSKQNSLLPLLSFTWNCEPRRVCPQVDDCACFQTVLLSGGQGHVRVFSQRLALHRLVSGSSGLVAIGKEAGTRGGRERSFTGIWKWQSNITSV